MGRPSIVVGGPPEFRGGPDIWAPEELLVGSLNTCMKLTFLTLAHARDLTPVGYESEAELEPRDASCFTAFHRHVLRCTWPASRAERLRKLARPHDHASGRRSNTR